MSDSRTKSVPAWVGEHFRAAFREWLQAEFGGNQSRAAAALHVTQGHISALLDGKRGPGLPVLIELYQRTGRSVDEWLGLTPPQQQGRREELIAAIVHGVADEMARRGMPTTPAETPRPLPPAPPSSSRPRRPR